MEDIMELKEDQGVEVFFRLVVKRTDSGFTVTPVGCQNHSATLKMVGDHYELGETAAEGLGKCLLSRAVRFVAADPTVRVRMVDDHVYGFVD
jgi:hypothetical protein